MPIFSYSCAKCGKKFEELVFSASDEAGVRCPGCGDREIRKELSTFSVGAARRPSGPCGSESPSPGCASRCPSGGCGLG